MLITILWSAKYIKHSLMAESVLSFLVHRLISFKLSFYLVRKCIWFSTYIPKISNFYAIIGYTIDYLIKMLYHHATIGCWQVGKQRFFGSQVWVVAQKSFYVYNLPKKFFATFISELCPNVSCSLLYNFFCIREPYHFHIASLNCKSKSFISSSSCLSRK